MIQWLKRLYGSRWAAADKWIAEKKAQGLTAETIEWGGLMENRSYPLTRDGYSAMLRDCELDMQECAAWWYGGGKAELIAQEAAMKEKRDDKPELPLRPGGPSPDEQGAPDFGRERVEIGLAVLPMPGQPLQKGIPAPAFPKVPGSRRKEKRDE